MEATKVQNLVVLDPPQKNLNVEIIADVLAKLRTTNSRLDKERSMCHALTKSPLNRNSLALQS